MTNFGKLTQSRVDKMNVPGKYGDGNGLYLQITKRLSKSWIFRYTQDDTEHYVGLGALHTVSLEEAREAAREARGLLYRGIDPLRARQDLAAKHNKTFDECAAEYIAVHQAGWRNPKHKNQWKSSVQTYASPVIGNIPVRLIDTPHILKILNPLWITRTITASRLQERIARVLAWSATLGYRAKDNPAIWRGHLEELLPPPSRIWKVRHYPAMPYGSIGAFYRQLQSEPGLGAKALQMTILTASRSVEILSAQWKEIDWAQGVWIIPDTRMKSGSEHRVPLVEATRGILQSLTGLHPVWIFPGRKYGCPLANTTMLKLLHKMDSTGATVHGFRSSFRVWAAEQTSYPRELVELALAHKAGSAVEIAYQRSDLLEPRRKLMNDWANWCRQTG